MALIVDVADAVVDRLNENEFSQDFTAERRYLPDLELTDTGVLHVTVVMRSLATTPAARGEVVKEEIKIDVAVRKKLQEIEENNETDDLVDLVQEIIRTLRLLKEFAGVRCTLIENSPVYLPEHMRTLRQFTSVITMTLKVIG